MNSSQINAEQKAVNVMESIVAHDFSKVISRPCKTSATRMNIGFAPVPLCA